MPILLQNHRVALRLIRRSTWFAATVIAALAPSIEILALTLLPSRGERFLTPWLAKLQELSTAANRSGPHLHGKPLALPSSTTRVLINWNIHPFICYFM
jgi:hypothetical protein